jgi:hypothetical protein
MASGGGFQIVAGKQRALAIGGKDGTADRVETTGTLTAFKRTEEAHRVDDALTAFDNPQ